VTGMGGALGQRRSIIRGLLIALSGSASLAALAGGARAQEPTESTTLPEVRVIATTPVPARPTRPTRPGTGSSSVIGVRRPNRP